MNFIKKVSILVCFIALALPGKTKFFSLTKEENKTSIINLIPEETSLLDENGFSKFIGNHAGRTSELGLPDLPTYSTFFQMKPAIDYQISYTVNESYIINNVKLMPSQPLTQNGNSQPAFVYDHNYYNNSSKYPIDNIAMGAPVIMRNVEMSQVSFTPYKYNPSTQTLEVYSNIDIKISESGYRDSVAPTITKRSRLFEELFEDIVINYSESRDPDDYQTPTILYICGGNSASNNDVQELIEWRHKQGYNVQVVEESESGGSYNNLANFIENAYNSNNPPEIVGLIGDTGGSYSLAAGSQNWGGGWYGYEGATDIFYTLIDGNDLMPDLFIGRISVNSSSEIDELITKTIAYEKATYINSTGTNWYESAALAGDPDESGNSTIITNQYIENLMINHGMENVMTDYDGSGVQTFMENSFQSGILYYNYRGWYGGYGSYPTSSLNNSWKTPFVTTITCGTGDFNGTSSSEAFIREGSASNPEGAVASIGVATTGTHTAYNNIVDMGIYEAIFSLGLSTAGAANHYGDVAILETYPSNPNDAALTFMAWSNLIGDPALHLWSDTPKELNPIYTSEINQGTTMIDVLVYDEDGDPVKDARVTLLQGNDDIFVSGYTDDNGATSLSWEFVGPGAIDLTIIKRNHIPHEGIVNINSNTSIAIGAGQIEGDSNNDGELNPGESITLYLPISNTGTSATGNILASLSSNSELLNVIDSYSEYGVISQNSSSSGSGFVLSLDSSAIDMEDLGLYLEVTDGNNDWIAQIPIPVYGPSIIINFYDIVGSSLIQIGEDNTMNINITNIGSKGLSNLTAELTANGYDITITDDSAQLLTLLAGETSNIGSFSIRPSSDIINGSEAILEFNFTDSNGYNRSNFISVPMGRVFDSDPTGPDLYGYMMYDSGDNYDLAPTYEWIEIADGSGVDLNMNDSGNGVFTMYDDGSNSSTTTITLPFDVQFYGTTYDKVTVCTNGFITFGESDVASFRNYPLPGAGGPSPMVAAFWDDLRTGSGGDVYYLSDDSKFIVQWDNMRTYYNSSYRQTFQIIIYNKDEIQTLTGDNEIVLQYQEYNNVSSGSYPEANTPIHGCYSSVGIENHLGNDGLQYSFNNVFATSAMDITNGTAILITTGRESEDDILLGDINSDGILNILDIVTLVNLVLGSSSPDEYQAAAGDINSDGILNILDIVTLVNIVLNNS